MAKYRSDECVIKPVHRSDPGGFDWDRKWGLDAILFELNSYDQVVLYNTNPLNSKLWYWECFLMVEFHA